MNPGASGLSVRHSRQVEWLDTDASGTFHHSQIIRWVEAAELKLYREAGIDHLFGRAPRVHYEVDYRSTVYFDDVIDIHLSVQEIGRTSMTMAFTVTTQSTEVATGQFTIVHAPNGGPAMPWPADVRAALGLGYADT